LPINFILFFYEVHKYIWKSGSRAAHKLKNVSIILGGGTGGDAE